MDDGARGRLLVAGAITAAVLGLSALVGAGGWPGEPSGCIANQDCYCEAFTGGLIEQPVNTLSNLGFIAVGLWVIAAGRSGRRPNRSGTELVYANLYGATAIFLGVGSMLFHGSMTEWGGWFDLVSMHAFITFLLLYNVAVALSRSTQWFLRSWSLGNVVLAAVLWVMDNGYGKFVFGSLIVVTLAAEYYVARPPARVSRDRTWLWAALGTYVAGNVIWLLSRDGGPLCAPESVLQGHALWHLTSAAAVGMLWRYLRSEADERQMAATLPGGR